MAGKRVHVPALEWLGKGARAVVENVEEIDQFITHVGPGADGRKDLIGIAERPVAGQQTDEHPCEAALSRRKMAHRDVARQDGAPDFESLAVVHVKHAAHRLHE